MFDILDQKYLFHMRLECNDEYEHLRYSRQAHAIVQKRTPKIMEVHFTFIRLKLLRLFFVCGGAVVTQCITT